MRQLNKEAYEVTKDNLVYDSRHPLDAVNVTVEAADAGMFLRGQVLDFTDGKYSAHKSGGAVSVIVAESTKCTAEDAGTVTVPVYTSGTVTVPACITEEGLTETDLETFRSKGIYLK